MSSSTAKLQLTLFDEGDLGWAAGESGNFQAIEDKLTLSGVNDPNIATDGDFDGQLYTQYNPGAPSFNIWVCLDSSGSPGVWLDISSEVLNNVPTGKLVPTGTVIDYAGNGAPSGYLLCDGSAVNRTTYASLFNVIGTTFGNGDGSTTFNVPDIRGRVSVGSGQGSGLTSRSLSAKGGLETVQLSISQMPAHTHQQIGRHDSGTGGGNQLQSGNLSGGPNYTAPSSTPNTGSTGGTAAHENMQPFIVLKRFIKT